MNFLINYYGIGIPNLGLCLPYIIGAFMLPGAMVYKLQLVIYSLILW